MKHVSSKIQVRYRKNRQTFFILIKINIDNNYLLQQPAVGCFTQRYACTIFSLFQLARIQSENISINFRTSQQRTIFGNLYLYIFIHIYICIYIYISYTLSYLYVCNYLCTLVYSYFCGCGIFDCTLKNRTTNKSAQVKWPRYESLLWTTHKQGRWLSIDLRSRHVQVVFANPVSSS